MNTAEVIEKPDTEVSAFNEYESKINEFQIEAKAVVFDYDDKEGNKEARSFRGKIRKLNPLIDQKHKEEKAEYLRKGKLLDAEKNRLKLLVSDITSPITIALDLVEQKEADRIEALKARIAFLYDSLEIRNDLDSKTVFGELKEARIFVINESLEEFQAEAAIAKEKAITHLESVLEVAEKREQEAAELQRLREEEEIRKQQEHEARIKQEAAETARREAEEKAEHERLARVKAEKEAEELSAKKEKERIAAEERAEIERQAEIDKQALALETAKRRELEAEQRAAKAEQDAKEKAEREHAHKLEQDRIAAEKREANTKHKAKINNAAMAGFVAAGLSKADAKIAVTAIAKHQIENVVINY